MDAELIELPSPRCVQYMPLSTSTTELVYSKLGLAACIQWRFFRTCCAKAHVKFIRQRGTRADVTTSGIQSDWQSCRVGYCCVADLTAYVPLASHLAE
eukprot:6475863-Amphidinium_carterae.1